MTGYYIRIDAQTIEFEDLSGEQFDLFVKQDGGNGYTWADAMTKWIAEKHFPDTKDILQHKAGETYWLRARRLAVWIRENVYQKDET